MTKLILIALVTFAICMLLLHKLLYTWYKKEAGQRSWNLAKVYYWQALIMLSGFVATGTVLAFK